MSPARILVPTDFSTESRKALDYAGAFARQFGACITLLHVVEPVLCQADYGYGPITRRIPNQEMLRKAQTKLNALGKSIPGSEMKVSTLIRTGMAESEIIQAAKSSEIDLIVMGTHVHSGVERTPTGSTAEKVVGHAPCPVLVVRRKEREFVL